MGVLDDLKNAASKVYDNAKEKYQQEQERKQRKMALFSKFTFQDMKGLCKEYGKEPSPYIENPLSGKREKRDLNRHVYEGFVMNNVPSDFIKEYAQKHRINVPYYEPTKVQVRESKPAMAQEPTQEGQEAPRASKDEFTDYLDLIQTKFKPEPVRDEKELESQLSVWLKSRYEDAVRRQVQSPYGRIDIVLFGKYALELKIATDRSVLRDMVGQLRDYKKVYPDLATVILDIRSLERSVIEEYIKQYADDGVRSIIVEGMVRKGKGNRGITVNVSR